ncbi:prephenate dehydrogenase/arogenate dehydrogenase family protein [Streptomyces sp. INA 01156]
MPWWSAGPERSALHRPAARLRRPGDGRRHRRAGRSTGRAARLRGDVTAVDFRLAAELGHADLVVLAVPEPVALKAIRGLAAELRPDALLVDTLSVKGPVARPSGPRPRGYRQSA